MKTLILILLFSLNLHAGEKEALMTIKQLGTNLKKELKAAMKKSPSKALVVCNTVAMPITEQAAVKGIKVGRVSLKNRNPKNAPKNWMKPFIEKYHKGEIKKPYSVVTLKSGKKGIIKPIKTAPLCLKCHGNYISQATQNKIKELYPADKAVGYKVGQIRGFFWAEFKE